MYNDCQSPTTTTTTTIPNDTLYWYPKKVDDTPTCVHDTNYPSDYTANVELRASFLFNTQLDCCTAFPIACLGMFWYPNDEQTECLFGDDFPESMRGHVEGTRGVEGYEEVYLFFGEGDCCDVWSCGVSGTSTSTTATSTTIMTTGTTSAVGGSDATLPASTVGKFHSECIF